MKKGGIGIGSASIMLVFVVLCLAVFTLIAYVVADYDKALVDTEKELVTGYYEADALAEIILAEIIESDEIPSTVRGINIVTYLDSELDTVVAYYLCPISELKALHVRLAVREDSYDILSWRMIDTDEWVFDDRLRVWSGFDE